MCLNRLRLVVVTNSLSECSIIVCLAMKTLAGIPQRLRLAHFDQMFIQSPLLQSYPVFVVLVVSTNVILNIFQSLAFICSSIRQLYIIDEQITIVSSPDPLRSRVCYFKLYPIDDPSSIIGFIVYRAAKLFSATNIKIEFNSFQHILVLCKKNGSVWKMLSK